MRILVVEDDLKIAEFLESGLLQSGYTVDLAYDGQTADDLLSMHVFDLLICDIMLPKIDGIALVEKLRKKDANTPILFLSAKRSTDDRILGLQKGGDDYMTKPFSFSELIARVQALLRRSGILANSQLQQHTTTLKGGDIEIDLLSREVIQNGQKIDLQLKEFSLLEYFLRNQGRVLTKTQILERVWNYQFDPQTNVVDVLVFRLRNKIDRGSEKKHIQTIRGIGYVFQAD